MRTFRKMATEPEYQDKTIFGVTHGAFLQHLTYLLLGGCEIKALYGDFYIPHNNSLTIIDFEVNETDQGPKATARMIA